MPIVATFIYCCGRCWPPKTSRRWSKVRSEFKSHCWSVNSVNFGIYRDCLVFFTLRAKTIAFCSFYGLLLLLLLLLLNGNWRRKLTEKTPQMRRDDAATENCRLQCRPNVNETEMSSIVSENRTVTLTCQSCVVAAVAYLECVKGGGPGGLEDVRGKAPVGGLGTKSPRSWRFFVTECLNFDVLEEKN